MALNKNTGFSLLEVLVSLLLISFILFGFDALSVHAIRQTRSAFYFTVAANQLANLSRRLECAQSAADRDFQVQQWNRENEVLLPKGFGAVSGSFPRYVLTIYWGKTIHQCVQIRLGEAGCLTLPVQLV